MLKYRKVYKVQNFYVVMTSLNDKIKHINPLGELSEIVSNMTSPNHFTDENKEYLLTLARSVDSEAFLAHYAELIADYVSQKAENVQLKIHNETLKKTSEIDCLTGLYRRGKFLADLETKIDLSKRNGNPLALIYADIDNFKNVNDTHGHEAGDEVLRKVGETIISTKRSYDVAGR